MAKKHPLDFLADNTYLPMCPPLAKAAVYAFMEAYYRAGCPEVLSKDYNGVIGFRPGDYRRHQQQIEIVLNQLIPIFRAWQLDREQCLEVNRSKAAKMRTIQMSNAVNRKKNKTKLTDIKDSHTGIALLPPVREEFKAEFSDKIERQRIITSKRPAAPPTLKDN